jgi:hypothetical protein
LLLSDEGIDYVTHFGRDEMGIYMGSGIRIAKEFEFLVPTKIRLDYEGLKNIYKLTQLGAIHIPDVFPMQVKEEPVEIISDDEAEIEQINNEDEVGVGNEIQANTGVVDNVEEAGGVDHHHFEKNVTIALASVERPQALVCKNLLFINLISSSIIK